MRPVAQVIKHEIRKLIPVVIYFLITFNIVGLTKSLMLRQYGIDISTLVAATVGALVAGKVVLIADALPFMDPFRKVPITYNVLWRTVIYTVVALLVQWIEHGVRLWLHDGELSRTFEDAMSPNFWAIQIWLFLLFLVFCAFKGLIDVLGPTKTREIFVGRRAPTK